MRTSFKHFSALISTNTKLPLPVAFVIELISSIQLFHLILKASFSLSLTTNFSFSGFTRDLTSYFGAVQLFDPIASNTTLHIVWSCLTVYLLFQAIFMIFSIVYIGIKKLAFTNMRIPAIIYLLHTRLFFFPIQYFLMGIIRSSIRCTSSEQSDFYCKDSWLALTILACIVNVAFSMTIEIFFYDLNKTKNPYAIKTSIFHQIRLFHKSVGLITYFLLQELGYNEVFEGIAHILLSLLSLYVLFQKLPFYQYTLIKLQTVLTGLIIGASIVLLTRVFNADAKIMEIPWTILIFLCPKVTLLILQNLEFYILRGNFDTPEKAIHFITLIKKFNYGYISAEVHHDKIPEGGVLFNGALIQHEIETTDLKAQKQGKDFEHEIYRRLVEKLLAMYQKKPKAIVLGLFIARIYLKKLGNILQAMSLLKKMSSLDVSMPLRNSIEEFSVILKRTYALQYRDNDTNMNILEYFEYRDKANFIKEQIQIEVQKHLEFWQEVQKDNVNVKKTFDLANSIDVLSSKTEASFQTNLWHFTKTITNSLLLYKIYLEKIREMPNESRKAMKKFISVIHNPVVRHFLDVYSSEKAVLVLSLHKDTLGNILDVSASTQTLFDIEKSKMIGKDLTYLFSETFARTHMRLLLSSSKFLTHKIQHRARTLGKFGDQNLFELHAKFQLYPEIDKEAKVMMVLQKKSPPMPIFILTPDGTIEECSESIQKNPLFENIVLGVTKFQTLSYDFDSINSSFNILYQPKQGESTASTMSLLDPFAKRSLKHSFKRVQRSQAKTPLEEKLTTQTSESEKYDPDKVKSTCENYIQGSKLLFCGENHKQEIEYEIQIEPHVLDGILYKVVKIKGWEPAKPPLKFTSIDFERKTTPATQVGLDTTFADDFPIAQEREAGAIGLFRQDSSLPVPYERETGGIPIIKKDSSLLWKQMKYDFQPENIFPLKTQNSNLSKQLTPDLRFLMTTEDNRSNSVTPLPQAKNSSNMDDNQKLRTKLSSSMEVVKTQGIQRDMSVTSYATSGVYAIKAMKRVFGQGSTYQLPRNSFIMVTLLTIGMLILAIVFYVFTRQALSDHDGNSQIIDGAGQRLSDSISAWQYVTRLYLNSEGLGNDSLTDIQDSLLEQALSMLQTNNQVDQELSSTLSDTRLQDVYKAEVEFWEPYEGVTTTDQKINTFDATSILYSRYVTIASQLSSSTDLSNSTDVIYAMNNSANDYLVSSEKLYTDTRNLMESVLDTNIVKLELILVGQSILLGGTAIFLLAMCYLLILSYRRLFRALMKIEDHHLDPIIHSLKRVQMCLEVDLENKMFGVDSLGSTDDIKFVPKDQKKKGLRKKTGFSKHDDRFFVRGLVLYLLKYTVISLIFIALPACFFYSSLAESISNLKTLDNYDDQMSVLSKAQYQVNLLMTVFYTEMMFRNDTSMKIRGELPRTELVSALEEMNILHDELTTVFYGSGETVADETIQNILQDTICPYIEDLSSEIKSSCQIATDGGKLGLLSIDLSYITISTNYIDLYLATPTKADADYLVEFYSDEVRELMETLEATYNFMNDHLYNISVEKSDSFVGRQDVFFVAILVSIVVSFAVGYYFSIRKFWFVDMGRGRILKMIPYVVITENKALDFYLNRDFRKKKYDFGKR